MLLFLSGFLLSLIAMEKSAQGIQADRSFIAPPCTRWMRYGKKPVRYQNKIMKHVGR
jgi:hypothetical protein